MLEIVFLPVVLLATFPGGALLPAIILMVVYLQRRNGMSKLRQFAVIVATLTWIIYGTYETRMYFWMKTVIAPIRVDLLLIVPVLYLVTLLATIALWRGVKVTGTKPRADVDN
jgi:hypothetical protein